MDTVITINNLKDSTVEFDIETNGFDNDVDISARLVVSAQPVVFAFNCEKEAGKWVCKIPAMAYVTPSAYSFVIEVVADGYFFEALRGTLNITKTKDIYVTIPKSAKTIEPLTPTEEEEEDTSKKKTKTEVKSPIITARPTGVEEDKEKVSKSDIENLARQIMAGTKETKKEKPSEKKETKNEGTQIKDRAAIVREMLDSVIRGTKPKPRRFSLRDHL